MTWQRRLGEIVLAGGSVAMLGCGSGTSVTPDGSSGNVPGVVCGNANPDPCICGRPDASAQGAKLCDDQKACQAAGGTFDSTTLTEQDGAVVEPHCVLSDGGAVDGAAHD